MFDEIGKLVDLTFKNLDLFQDRSPFKKESSDQDISNLPAEVPGVIYHLQKKTSTFVIRIIESQNLRQTYLSIKANPADYTGLRLEEAEGDLSQKLRFFECDNLAVANAIKNQLSNKRFPLFEEHIFNVSDPSDSWWAKITPDSFRLLFKLSHTDSMNDLIKIGPLGDPDKCQEKFQYYRSYFNSIFATNELASAYGQFIVTPVDSSDFFYKSFVQLFTEGEAQHDFWMNLVNCERNATDDHVRTFIQEANFFLMELAMIRRFWIVIQKELS